MNLKCRTEKGQCFVWSSLLEVFSLHFCCFKFCIRLFYIFWDVFITAIKFKKEEFEISNRKSRYA
jgi:hypothetical protein